MNMYLVTMKGGAKVYVNAKEARIGTKDISFGESKSANSACSAWFDTADVEKVESLSLATDRVIFEAGVAA